MKSADMKADMKRGMKKYSAPLNLVLPATSANLCPAFDSAALALKLHLNVHAAVAAEFSIPATGRDREICGKLERNLLLETYKDVMQAEGKAPLALALKVNNSMPIGKGTG